MFVWQMVFVTQICFRRKWMAEGRQPSVRMFGSPYTSILGLALVTGIVVTTWWVDRMRITIFSGLVWLPLISVAYWIWEKQQRPVTTAVPTKTGLAGAGTNSSR